MEKPTLDQYAVKAARDWIDKKLDEAGREHFSELRGSYTCTVSGAADGSHNHAFTLSCRLRKTTDLLGFKDHMQKDMWTDMIADGEGGYEAWELHFRANRIGLFNDEFDWHAELVCTAKGKHKGNT